MTEARNAPDLPEGWRAVVLGDLGEFVTSSVDKKLNTAELPVRLVNYMDVYRSPYLTSHLDYMQVTASRSEISKSQVLTGDLLFTPSSETPNDVGHSAVVVEALPETLHSYHTVRLRIAASEEIDLRFRGRLANSAQVLKHFEKCATGSTRYTLSLADFRSAPVRIPPIAEQAKIALVLDTLDATISRVEAIIEKLKQVKQGLLHDLLTRGIDANGGLRPPQSEAPHLYMDSPLGWIPREWRFGPIESFLDRVIDYRGKTPTKTPSGIPLITAKNVRLGFIDPEPREFIGPESFDRWMTRGIPKRGDVLFTTEAPLGNVAQIDSDEQLAFAQRIIILQSNEATVGAFLKFLLLEQQFRRRLFAMGSGSTVEGIQQSTLRRLTIAVPGSVAEQHEIVQRLASADSRVDCELALLEKWQKAKLGLMDDLVTGRVRVTPLLT